MWRGHCHLEFLSVSCRWLLHHPEGVLLKMLASARNFVFYSPTALRVLHRAFTIRADDHAVHVTAVQDTFYLDDTDGLRESTCQCQTWSQTDAVENLGLWSTGQLRDGWDPAPTVRPLAGRVIG